DYRARIAASWRAGRLTQPTRRRWLCIDGGMRTRTGNGIGGHSLPVPPLSGPRSASPSRNTATFHGTAPVDAERGIRPVADTLGSAIGNSPGLRSGSLIRGNGVGGLSRMSDAG